MKYKQFIFQDLEGFLRTMREEDDGNFVLQKPILNFRLMR